MSKFSISWGIGFDPNSGGGNKDNATWEDVVRLLDLALLNSGSVGIEFTEQPELGPIRLSVEIDRKLSILCLGVLTDDDYDTRSFHGKNKGGEQIEILGNFWDPSLICEDFSVVVQAFKEFFQTGDVSSQILS